MSCGWSRATPPWLPYANVQEVMTSNLRGKLREALPVKPEGQRELESETGINIETDVDHVVACIAPPVDGTSRPPRNRSWCSPAAGSTR